MNISKRLISISFILINILGISIYFSFNPNFYLKHFDTPQITNINKTDIQNIYSFLQNKSDLNNNFTALEASHLRDVQKIFSIIYYILRISILVFVLNVSFLIYSKKSNQILKLLFIGSIITLSFILVLIFTTALNFRLSFNIFHEIFFPQGNRSFPIDSNLIKLFPESFFILISQKIFYTISIISLIIIIFYLIKKKTSREVNNI
ncbi:DUF1461 domain-containing protein [Candidatus Gracilibacteria bacterium]|nr:DUF1461 domain-containing protein [Candidatus Gracilibacteria bacterium]